MVVCFCKKQQGGQTLKTTTLILSAIVAALPLAANATQTIVQTQTPAAVGSDGTVKKAATSGPYVTIEPSPADQTHIATTAYVKGAYNDAIAAVNKVDADKQVKLKNAANNNPVLPKVMSGNYYDAFADVVLLSNQDQNIYDTGTEDVAYNLTGVHNNATALNDSLISAGTVIHWMRDAGSRLASKQDIHYTIIDGEDEEMDTFVAQTVNTTTPSATTLVSEAAVAGAINGATSDMATNTALNSKRIRIYTTWDDDTVAATTLVPFETAQ